jgi:glycine dehydrogenase
MPTSKIPLSELELRGLFIRRHIGPNQRQQQAMLTELGLNSLEELLAQAVPENILNREPLALTETISERAVIEHLRKMGQRNQVFTSMIGMGYYDTHLPAVIKRNVLENPAWYTAYTPYQAEISQGRLEALLIFQQMIVDLTGMEVANASLLDEATAAAEAMAMAHRLAKNGSELFFIDRGCHPQTIAVVQTRAHWLGLQTVVGDPYQELDDQMFFGVLAQYPASKGEARDLQSIIDTASAKKALSIVAADLLSLVLLKPPGEFGADIVVGSAQRFGVPLGYGGPHAAFFATKDAYKRSMPGRIVGVSQDAHGRPALRLALQTREQHIRRERATSNICTSQVLLAVIAAFYAMYHGPRGLTLIAGRIHRFTQILAAGLRQNGIEVLSNSYFDTLLLRVPNRARHIAAHAEEARINLRVIDADHLGISLDQTTTRQHLRTLWTVFTRPGAALPDINDLDGEIGECIPENLRRQSPFLQHPAFAAYHSETEMMRYMSKLARRDIALDRAMIPLGSCTMKLNAATSMQALSYHQFNNLHPFAPLYQTQGYQQLFEELEDMLCDLTGFAAISLQPNAGSQGEYTGLLTIRKYHEANGQGQRNICLIPASAHGTNPASAALAGLTVVVVACDTHGNISIDDLDAKLAEYGERVAALMITYPSTHGVYEESFRDICASVHQSGGQVYLDGANFNALAGLCRPGKIGADVAHLNLHKTFSIPHGGGGPGVGPIGVAQHLAPFLPDHPVVEGVNSAKGAHGTVGCVAAAPWGSAGILTISWAYIAMMGSTGLKQATLTAILNANYIAKRLAPYYPILYTGKNGLVAHECIIDLHAIRTSSGISVEDVAKRLMDYGFHAPTVAFPVADTLMIEPTESESKEELDRFCDALIAIRGEIAEIENGEADAENNLLHNSPHSQQLLLREWTLPYPMQRAFYPGRNQQEDKYWPPVGRIDNVYGDRHFVGSCIQGAGDSQPGENV